jgi:NitT/TauT family transport system permease protein
MSPPSLTTRLLAAIAPLALGVLVLVTWELAVRLNHIPPYLLPGPWLVAQTLVKDWLVLLPALGVTLKITLVAFAVAVVSGLALAMVMAQSPWLEKSLYPYAIILQTM